MKENHRNTTIPRIIHYCWFGRGDKSELALRCIAGWKKFLPFYEIIEWNEDNFDITINSYVKEAYDNKKYAFVSDFVRLFVLNHFGGIYMDTDVEVVKPLDQLLYLRGFVGFEDKELISTAVLGFEKGNKLIQEWLTTYEDRHFIIDGKRNTQTNVRVFTNLLLQYELIQDNSEQILQGGMVKIYPREYFSPLRIGSKKPEVTEKTYTIHHFEGTWLNVTQRIKIQFVAYLKSILGFKKYNKLRYIIQSRE